MSNFSHFGRTGGAGPEWVFPRPPTKRSEKVTHIVRLSGESGGAPKQVCRWLQRAGKGDWLWSFHDG